MDCMYSATSLTNNITFVYNNNSSNHKVSTASFIYSALILVDSSKRSFFDVVIYENPSQSVKKIGM